MHSHDVPQRAKRRQNADRPQIQTISNIGVGNENGAAHVLIVEDDADLRQSMVFVLSDEGYVVSDASDGLHALRLLEDGLRPNLILLDLMMPNMNGFQFREVQLGCEEIAAIPVIAWTAHNDPEAFVAPLCVDGVLKKPFDIPVFLDAVKQVLDRVRRLHA